MLKVRVDHTGPLLEPPFDGEWAIKFTVLEGPISHQHSTLIWDWSRWRDAVLPQGTKRRLHGDLTIRAGASVLEKISGSSSTAWLFGNTVSAALIGEKTTVLNDARNTCLSFNSTANISLDRFLDGTFPQIECLSSRSDGPAAAAPVIVLNGRDALDYLKPGARSAVVVLLDWSEIDEVVRNTLAPWLAADDPKHAIKELAGIKASGSWHIVASALRIGKP